MLPSVFVSESSSRGLNSKNMKIAEHKCNSYTEIVIFLYNYYINSYISVNFSV